MDCPLTTPIDPNVCIGNTLSTFNANFEALDDAICELNDDVNANFLRTALNLQEISANGPAAQQAALDNLGIFNRLPKAWVTFKGTESAVDGTVLDILEEYNVTSLVTNIITNHRGAGDTLGSIIVNFTTPIEAYGMVGGAVLDKDGKAIGIFGVDHWDESGSGSNYTLNWGSTGTISQVEVFPFNETYSMPAYPGGPVSYTWAKPIHRGTLLFY